MGRGRQKAKHTKVARQLKYFSPDTDLSNLERELGIVPKNDPHVNEAEQDDPWAEYADKYNDSVDDEDSDTDGQN